jgi:preprotein translocase subunit YajC
MKHIIIIFIFLAVLMFSACQNNQSNDKSQQETVNSMSVLPEVVAIKEAFTTLRDESDNVDSPALWHGE